MASVRMVIILIHAVVASSLQAPHCPSPCECQGNFEVYCNRTGITEIPTRIPIETTVLDLGGNNITRITKAALRNLPNLAFLGLSENSYEGDEIEAGALDLPKLVTLDLTFNNYMRIPPNLPKNMSKLYFMNNPIQILDPSSFENYTAIEYVDMSNCDIQHIMPNTFDKMADLNSIYIAFTPLTNRGLPKDVFAKNTKLQLLGLRFNRLTSLIPGLPSSLQNLDYVGNYIKTLPSFAFKDTPNLVTLSFWDGQVKDIQDNAFSDLGSLEILDFMNGTLSSPITNHTFAGLKSLKTLYLSINRIPSIEVGALQGLENLSSLWLGGNNLTTLKDGILAKTFAPHLSTVYLDFNPWYCDCHLRWVREKVDEPGSYIQDPHLIKCQGPPPLAGKAFDELKPEDFVCHE